jgi:catechol 2,3-dioxygenase-like lactoylglutathione lyase family enzyme
VTTTQGVVRCSLGVSDLDAAVDFYSGVWGLEIVSKSADLVYLTARGSSSPWELRLRAADRDRLDLITYATADDRALMDIVALAEQNEWPVIAGPAPATEPGGGLAARVVDPDGRTIELVTGVVKRSNLRGPVPGDAVPLSLSHVVINSPDPGRLVRSYDSVLGLRVTDYLEDKMIFMRATAAHHTCAVATAPHVSLNHVAFEMISIDDFMRATGRLIRSGHELLWGPGRHGPGNNTFAYFHDPNGFIAEFTTGLERITDPQRWEPRVWESVPEQSDMWGTANPRPGEAFVGRPDPGTGDPPPV